MFDQQVILMVGYQASGKSSFARTLTGSGSPVVRVSRDEIGGATADMVPVMVAELAAGKSVVLDATFPTIESRAPFIAAARQRQVPVHCAWMQTSMDDAQVNACIRMYDKVGHLPAPEEIAASADPNMVPIAAIYRYAKQFEKPTTSEGFSAVDKIPFTRTWGPEHANKALILDADSTVREVAEGCATKWPTDPAHVTIMPNRQKKIAEYRDSGYHLLGVSNQSGVAKSNPPAAVAEACYRRTNELLGLEIEWRYCPHSPAGRGITCFCRKPIPGLGIEFVMRYKLDPAQCIYVGDKTEDRTFARKCGFQFHFAHDFFA